MIKCFKTLAQKLSSADSVANEASRRSDFRVLPLVNIKCLNFEADIGSIILISKEMLIREINSSKTI